MPSNHTVAKIACNTLSFADGITRTCIMIKATDLAFSIKHAARQLAVGGSFSDIEYTSSNRVEVSRIKAMIEGKCSKYEMQPQM